MPCKVKKGSKVSLGFDFTPNAYTSHVSSSVHASAFGFEIEAPPKYFDPDACKYIKGAEKCALKKDVKYTYDYTATIPDKGIPKEVTNIPFTFKFRIKDADNSPIVCFSFPVELVDP